MNCCRPAALPMGLQVARIVAAPAALVGNAALCVDAVAVMPAWAVPEPASLDLFAAWLLDTDASRRRQ